MEPAVDPSPIEAVPFRLPDRADPYENARPWRVTVAEGSMRPALEPGDWLLVDPTTHHWPRRGAIVVVRQPASGLLVVKRVAARPGDTLSVAGHRVQLGPTEAWLLGDAPAVSVDSRIYGPVTLDHLVGRAWLRYGPMGRPLGLIDRPAASRRTQSG